MMASCRFSPSGYGVSRSALLCSSSEAEPTRWPICTWNEPVPSRGAGVSGFDGISVFEAPDGDLVALARQRPVMATRRRVRLAQADLIRQAGFPLLDTGEELHWTVVLPLAAPDFFLRLRAAFNPQVDNPGVFTILEDVGWWRGWERL